MVVKHQWLTLHSKIVTIVSYLYGGKIDGSSENSSRDNAYGSSLSMIDILERYLSLHSLLSLLKCLETCSELHIYTCL